MPRTEHAAEVLQVRYDTARCYVKKGLLTGYETGRGWRVAESGVKRFIGKGHALHLTEEETYSL